MFHPAAHRQGVRHHDYRPSSVPTTGYVTHRHGASRLRAVRVPTAVAGLQRKLTPIPKWHRRANTGFPGNWRRHQSPGAGGSKSGESRWHKDLPPDGMAGIMPATGECPEARAEAHRASEQQLALSTYVKLGSPKTSFAHARSFKANQAVGSGVRSHCPRPRTGPGAARSRCAVRAVAERRDQPGRTQRPDSSVSRRPFSGHLA